MAAVGNLVQETTTSTGTGNLTVSAVNGKRTFNTEFGTGGSDVFFYFVSNRDAAEWEVGTGSLSTSTTLVRDTVIASSNAGSAVNFSAGTKDVVNDIAVRTTGADFGTTNILTTGAVGRDTDNDIDWGTDDQLTVTVGGAAIGVFTDTAITFTTNTFGISRASGIPSLRLTNQDAIPSGITHTFDFYAQNDAAENTRYTQFRSIVDDDSDGTEDGRLEVRTIVAGTATSQVFVSDGVYGNGAIGGAKGNGSSNWTACYDDNTLLTCYVFDQALDGSVDNVKWDNKVPNRIYEDGEEEVRTHEPLRKFKERIGTDYDPLTLDGYAKHWKEKKHLTSMPNEDKFNHGDMAAGEWIQRLVETVEIQAVLIEELNQRLKVLEG